MESGNDALRAEDRVLLLVNRLTMAGARPALVMELMGRLVKKSEIGYRMRVTRSTEDVDDRGRAPGRRFLERLPKDGSAVLAHVLYNMAQAQARCSSADQCWQASARARRSAAVRLGVAQDCCPARQCRSGWPQVRTTRAGRLLRPARTQCGVGVVRALRHP